jgi:hypothetical protein
LEGRTIFDLSNGYALTVSNGDSWQRSCGVMLRLPYKFIGDTQHEIDRVEQWIAEKENEKILFETKSWVELGLKISTFDFRPREFISVCSALLFFGRDPDEMAKDLVLIIGSPKDLGCGRDLGS